jgi:uncharacterized protein YjbJ (UPF0337 family)
MAMDRVKGAAKDAMGKGKEKAGEATDNEEMKDEGQADQVEGKVQGAVGKGKEKLDEIKDKAK